jgi:hypothetical protein
MDWQPIAALGAVVVALVYVARAALRALRGRSGSCGGCRCSDGPSPAGEGRGAPLIPRDQLTIRRGGSR